MEILNVVVMLGGIIDSIESFVVLKSSEKEGVIEKAKKLFKKKVLEHIPDLIESDIKSYIEDGTFECSNYKVHLIWSN